VRIARQGVEASERLGRHRWVVERTLAWRNRYRRLTIRHERREDIHQAFLTLGCARICFNHLQRAFGKALIVIRRAIPSPAPSPSTRAQGEPAGRAMGRSCERQTI